MYQRYYKIPYLFVKQVHNHSVSKTCEHLKGILSYWDDVSSQIESPGYRYLFRDLRYLQNIEEMKLNMYLFRGRTMT